METLRAIQLMHRMVVGHEWIDRDRVVCFCGDTLGLLPFGCDPNRPWQLLEAHLKEHGGIENHMVEVAYGR